MHRPRRPTWGSSDFSGPTTPGTTITSSSSPPSPSPTPAVSAKPPPAALDLRTVTPLSPPQLSCPSLPPTTAGPVDEVAGTGVTTFVYMVARSDGLFYPSNAGQRWPNPADEPEPYEMATYWRIASNMRSLEGRGLDPLRVRFSVHFCDF